MMAKGFRPVGWVAAVGAAALCCYMLSLRVASERADLTKLDRKILAARQNIRALEIEVGTRSRVPQLEEWNEEVLALAAPVSGQVVEGQLSLARFDVRQAPPPMAEAEVRLAAAGPDSRPAPRPAAPEAAPRRAPAPVAEVRRASLAVVGHEEPAARGPRLAATPSAALEPKDAPRPLRQVSTRAALATSPARTAAARGAERRPAAAAERPPRREEPARVSERRERDVERSRRK